MFKKNHTLGLSEGLSEASRLIDSAISKRQGDQRKRSFLEKKKLHTRENGFTMNTQKYRITWWMDRAMKQSTHQFHKTFFHMSKCSACSAEKTLQLRITKKEWI